MCKLRKYGIMYAEVSKFNVYVKQGIGIFWMERQGLLKGGVTLDK